MTVTLFRRILGALLALAGVLVLATITPVLSHLDSEGRAAFTAPVDTDGIVSIDQRVLNRVDAPVELIAHSADDARVFIGAAPPSAVRQLIGQADQTRVKAVNVDGWSLTTDVAGKGAAREPSTAPIWERQATGKGSAQLTIEQAEAPQRVLITTPSGGRLTSVELAFTNQGWRTGALWLMVLGVVLLVGGALLALLGLWRPRTATERSATDGTATGPVAPTDRRDSED